MYFRRTAAIEVKCYRVLIFFFFCRTDILTIYRNSSALRGRIISIFFIPSFICLVSWTKCNRKLSKCCVKCKFPPNLRRYQLKQISKFSIWLVYTTSFIKKLIKLKRKKKLHTTNKNKPKDYPNDICSQRNNIFLIWILISLDVFFFLSTFCFTVAVSSWLWTISQNCITRSELLIWCKTQKPKLNGNICWPTITHYIHCENMFKRWR